MSGKWPKCNLPFDEILNEVLVITVEGCYKKLIFFCLGKFIILILILLEVTQKIFLRDASLKSFLATEPYHEKT